MNEEIGIAPYRVQSRDAADCVLVQDTTAITLSVYYGLPVIVRLCYGVSPHCEFVKHAAERCHFNSLFYVPRIYIYISYCTTVFMCIPRLLGVVASLKCFAAPLLYMSDKKSTVLYWYMISKM